MLCNSNYNNGIIMSLKDKIKSVQKEKYTEVKVPAWDCSIFLKKLSVKEMQKWLNFREAHKDNTDENSAMLLIYTCHDETQKPVWSEGDLQEVLELDFSEVNHLVDQCLKVNGLLEKSVEDAKKN